MVKSFFAGSISILLFVFACISLFIVGYVVLVAFTIPQLPGWAQEPVTEWMLDIPQESEYIEEGYGGGGGGNNGGGDNDGGNGGGGGGSASAPAASGPVLWSGYVGPNGVPFGFPLWGAIVHPWAGEKPSALLGCEFQDSHYRNHTGVDSPVVVGTPIHSTMGGEVVWAGYIKGGWGRLVVIENDGYQIWMAHLSEINVEVGQIIEPGEIIGLSGGDPSDPEGGNSSGPHLHYGIKKKTGTDTYVWIDPETTFDASQYSEWGCGK